MCKCLWLILGIGGGISYGWYSIGMKLIFLYGPPAAGKLTVGTELAGLLHYKIIDNHKTVEMLRQLFPFEDPNLNKIRRRLQAKFRLEMFEEAAKAGVNFITTCATAGPQHFGFYRETLDLVTRHGGQVLFVQLLPSREVMLHRVEHDSRKGLKIENRQHLARLFEQEPELFQKFPDQDHLTIDNSNLSPRQAAQAIIAHYDLVPVTSV